MSEQVFEAKTWADAEITPGPVRLAMEKAEREKAERENKNQTEGVKPETDQEQKP